MATISGSLALRNDVWNALLDAEMNCLYWDALVRRFTRRDRWLKILLATLTGGTAVGLFFSLGGQHLWTVVSAIASVTLAALSIIDIPGQIRGMVDLKKAWAALEVQYQGLWIECRQGCDEATLLPRFLEARTREAQHKSEEGKFPRDRKLIVRCQAQVRAARGLNKGAANVG